MDLKELQQRAYTNSLKKGFHDDRKKEDPSIKLMLVVSECAEAQEAQRDDEKDIGVYRYAVKDSSVEDDTQPINADGSLRKPVGFWSELADIVIRVGDLAGQLGIDLDWAVRQKMAYNETRPYKHGKGF
jgi:NTP pyrophosphatase (non-canonical NTP hydrolase)